MRGRTSSESRGRRSRRIGERGIAEVRLGVRKIGQNPQCGTLFGAFGQSINPELKNLNDFAENDIAVG